MATCVSPPSMPSGTQISVGRRISTENRFDLCFIRAVKNPTLHFSLIQKNIHRNFNHLHCYKKAYTDFTSSTITAPPQGGLGKHDVFVCFRGEDTRYNFVCFLHRELMDRNGIETYIDNRLGGGEELEPALLKKIEESLITLVIFSENFADSIFCLRELSKILDCKKKKGQIVIPVFYRVNPTHIQELQGSFDDEHTKHEGKCKAGEVERWRHALKEIANLKGWDSNIIKYDTMLVDAIVEDIQQTLRHMPSRVSPSTDSGRLVGIDSPVKEVKKLLGIESPIVLVVGLWGMPGIGKTTIAEVVYDQISPQYEGSCFFRNVREESRKYGLVHVLQEIIGEVLGIKDLKLYSSESLPDTVERMLQRKKVLIVLDNVSSCEQIEVLGKVGLLGQGSRIILTSKDKQVLENQPCEHETYKVQELGDGEAFQLFELHAFKGNDQCGEEFKELAERAVSYAKGNPLALKVLGSNLYNKDIKEWKNTLADLEGGSLFPEIQKILMTSYDGLDWKQQRIFLDIACFFGRCNRDFVQYTLDQCGFNAERGIDRLIDMCLLNISDNEIWMHDLLQQLGQDIVLQENYDDPRKRSRLWIPEDIKHVLTNYRGTETVQAISLDLSKIQEMKLSPTVFQEMCNLRLVEFYFPEHSYIFGERKLLFPEGLEFLPKTLRILRWDCCSLKSMPSKFCLTNLVQLQMRNTIDLELWNEVSPLVNLKVLEVTWSLKLTTINQVLQKAPNLEVLNLSCCKLLRNLDLSKVPNLKALDLSYCGSLDEVPSSIKNCTKLSRLILRACTSLHTLSSEIEHLSQLVQLDISRCESLQSLPSYIGRLKCLEELDLSHTKIEIVPESIKQLSNLTTLSLSNCQRIWCLPELPSSLKCLNASECRSLESVASIFTQAENDEYEAASEDFDFYNCQNLCENSKLTIIADAKLRIHRMATSLCKQGYSGEPIGFRLCVPGERVPEWFSLGEKIKSLPQCDSTTKEKFLGFAFCGVVLGLYVDMECECHLITESGPQTLHFSYDSKNRLVPFMSPVKHLLMGYDWKVESNCFFKEASFEFYSFGNISVPNSGVCLLFA